MTGAEALGRAVAGFAAVDLAGWSGLPAALPLTDLAEVLALHLDDHRHGLAGEPPEVRPWVPAYDGRYAGGLRVWLEGDDVVALEGLEPVDAAGDFLGAPDLGAPQARLESVLGPLLLEGGELVHASRGLALRTNPDNGLLLGVVGFAPMSVAAYRRRVRPEPEPTRPLTSGGAW